MDKLRECPFCEGEATRRMTGNNSVTFRYAYQCAECLAMTGWFSTNKEAVAAWNRRAYASRDAEVEALKAIIESIHKSLDFADKCRSKATRPARKPRPRLMRRKELSGHDEQGGAGGKQGDL